VSEIKRKRSKKKKPIKKIAPYPGKPKQYIQPPYGIPEGKPGFIGPPSPPKAKTPAKKKKKPQRVSNKPGVSYREGSQKRPDYSKFMGKKGKKK